MLHLELKSISPYLSLLLLLAQMLVQLLLSLTISNDLHIVHLRLTSCDRCWSSFPLTIHCHDSDRVGCVSVQSPHHHTALIGRHLTGRRQCADSLPLSSLSPPPTTTGGCDHHTVRDVSTGIHQGQRLPADPHCGVTDMCNHHITWGRRCCGEGGSIITNQHQNGDKNQDIHTLSFERAASIQKRSLRIFESCSKVKAIALVYRMIC